jgi:uncharacterized protein YndB with AHSA1/START domain
MTQLLALRRQIVVPAGVDLAFSTFTDDIGSWWPLADGFSVFGAGASVGLRDLEVVETAPDGREASWGTVLDWDPPYRLRLTWHPGQPVERASEVEVTFVEVSDGQTLVTLEHSGWERLADPAAAREEYNHGWPIVLAQYIARVSEAVDAAEEVDKEPAEVWFALMHTAGPAQEPGGSPFANPLFGNHITFLQGLRAAGLLVAAGSLDGSAEGMTVVRLPDRAAAADLVRRAQDEDGSVAQGLFQVRVRPWRVALTG